MKIPKNVSSEGVHEDPHQPMAYERLETDNDITRTVQTICVLLDACFPLILRLIPCSV